MAAPSVSTRLIYCVDGTYCTPDGPSGKGHGNISNVYRIYASVKSGLCFDEVQRKQFIQEKEYEPGIGSADELGVLEKGRAGIWGSGFEKIIRKVYERCCKLDSTDEVWLYGFSRGAYIVRAVAGLLDFIWALQSAGTKDFESEYRKALGLYKKAERRLEHGSGEFHCFISSHIKPAPRIQFVGAFDTVKALHDGSLYDISFNDSTQHFRHALALNENRKAMTPEYVFPNYGDTKTKLLSRTFVQAWFVGAHIDMGGSAANDGLSLYPLQWIVSESQQHGLVLGFSNVDHPLARQARIDNPLQVIFPKGENGGKNGNPWTYTSQNGVKVDMYDIREVHERDAYKGRYSIKINKCKGLLWPREVRKPFIDDAEKLSGYVPFAPQGTIIHPSVYQFLDVSIVTVSDHSILWYRESLERWRPKMLGENQSMLNLGFWNDTSAVEIDELKTIRILVCGNTGVGKSTLINRVFGVNLGDEVTQISARKRGIHNVQHEITHESRPDLVIHDSGGFEAGDESQLGAVGTFVKERSSCTQIKDRLHIIWFCIEMGSDRNQQTATAAFFKAVSEHAAEVPVIVVATKMDRFRSIQYGEAREEHESSTNDLVELDRKCTDYAAAQLEKRIDLIEAEMREVEGSHFDACVDVARNDPESIKRLNQVTLQNVRNENLRLLYVAAQVADIDLKITAAITETMRIYRKVLGTAAGLGAIPTAPSSNRTASAISVCKAVAQCFGIPTVNYKTIYEIVKCTAWDDLGHNFGILFAEGIAAAGLLFSIGLYGMPVFLAAGAVNIPLVVPATTRLMLMLASDLILIFVRAFKETTNTCVGQPLLKDVERAAAHYVPLSRRVHKDILQLVPKRDVRKSFRYNDVRSGLEEVIKKFKKEVTKDLSTSVQVRPNKETLEEALAEKLDVQDEVEDMKADIENGKDALEAELEQRKS